MPRYILKIKGQKKTSYMIWSTIVDAPVIYNMTADEVRDWHKRSYGTDGDSTLEAKMKNVEKYGSSIGKTPQAITLFNRAGKGEKALSFREIVEIYVDLSCPEQ